MRKETYITPTLEVLEIQPSHLVCASSLGTEDIISSGDIIEWDFIF